MWFKRIVNFALATLAYAILLLSFQYNYFGAASSNFFENHQRYSESLVVGRIVESRSHGYASHGGFLGIFTTARDRVGYQYDKYSKGDTPDSAFETYKQSAGLQGIFYYSTDNIFSLAGIKNEKRLMANKLITSALLAFLIVLFLSITASQIGYTAAITTLVFLTASQWLVVFSNNLYWMFFLTLAPVVYSTYFLHTQNTRSVSFKLLYLGLFSIILIKSLAGYEYITTILIASVTPLVFFSVKYKWTARNFLIRFFYSGLAGLLGFFVAIAIHLGQLTIRLGSLDNAYELLLYTVAKRTHGQPEVVDEVYRQSLESSISEVILKYWNGVAFDLNSLFGNGGTISFNWIIIFIVCLMIYGSITSFFRTYHQNQMRQHWALTITFFFSLLAPISWYVLAKGHSYIHTHLNHVLWYVPTLLWGAAYIGFIFSQEFHWVDRLSNRKKPSSLKDYNYE
ncbi:MAG: hypothetical protein KBT77_08165 [Thalassolituus oleivorans]|uniref:hypothetical protein n=1 Tax=Thalassolituus oleivorans TaxID=187493 RepID=UPI001B4B105A|nr:hypothetical protein [Thalassolituus oleivorans]MBQ0727309.1 hypothetical protein [Thalassolituus oleivorans]MBQ0780581.1 hypothetical protein [Thalassolituus oleivorans]